MKPLRLWFALAAIVVAYFTSEELAAWWTADHGPLRPDGRLDPIVLVLTLLVVALRLVAIFVVPAVVAHRVLDVAFDRVTGTPRSRSSPNSR